MENRKLTEKIIGYSMKVHSALGPGFLESVYKNALSHELQKAEIKIECERRLDVRYDGIVVGQYVADIVVDYQVILDLKALHSLNASHEVQLVNYLTATGIEVGLLLNFGQERLKFKRKLRTLPPTSQPQSFIL